MGKTAGLQRGTGEITNLTDLVDSSDGLDSPYSVTIHNDQIYWTDSGTKKIQIGRAHV